MAPIPPQLAAALAGRYTLERELGRGGMATVWLADDLRHRRRVAIKVLDPELARAVGAERFLREIEIAAGLHHPHILPLYDSGGSPDGILWYVMPLAEGESLRDRLERERQLPVDEAVRIAREVADALAYAHAHGVVHRDVKPENILLESGHAVVADFGIAKAVASAGAGDTLTATGVSVGTPAYMSPEQATGERDLDARSDVYSLGVVLYEMLAGEPPFTGATAQAVIARRFAEPPRPIRTVRDAVPPPLEHAVLRALSRAPADRWPSATDFARALEAGAERRSPRPRPRRHTLAATLVVGLLLGTGALITSRRAAEPPSPPAAEPPSRPHAVRLAVLPFENRGDSADAYFADGMTDALRGKLTGLPGVQVIARASSVQYAGNATPPAQIAAELGARYLLTGTVRWAKAPDGTSRVQVSPELVEVGDDGSAASRWQQPFDAPLTDVFTVQGEIATKVAEAMHVALGGAEQATLASAPTRNAAAYDAYLRAEAAWYAGASVAPAAIREAIAHYEQAVRLDGSFALAWARLGEAAAVLYANSAPTRALAEQAREATERGVALEPEEPAALIARGAYHDLVEKEHGRALASLEAALRLAPRDPAVLYRLAIVERRLGRWEDALRHAETAYALDPRSADAAGQLSITLVRLRRPDEARGPAERALALVPGSPSVVQERVMVELGAGDLAAARRVLAGTTAIPPAELAAYMAVYEDLGWVLDDAAQRLVLTLGPEQFDSDRAAWALVRAQLHAWRGDSLRARAWGDSAAHHFARHLREVPDDAQLHVLRGLALAYAGRKAEAIREGERGVELRPIEASASGAYLVHQLARTYLLVGEPDKSLEQLERIMAVPYYVTPAWLAIDPSFAPLRGHPRFERLVASRASR